MSDLPKPLDDLFLQMSRDEYSVATCLPDDFKTLWEHRFERKTQDWKTDYEVGEYWFVVGHLMAWQSMKRIIARRSWREKLRGLVVGLRGKSG